MITLTIFVAVWVMPPGISLADEPRELPPVEPVTRELLAKRAAEKKARKEARKEAGEPDDAFNRLEEGEYKDLFEAFMARLETMNEENRAAPTVDSALHLVDQLYDDMGDTGLNRRWQDMVVTEILRGANRADLDQDTLNVFRDGLLVYVDAGGGASDPFVKIRLARAVATLGGPAYPRCDEQAVRLTEEAAAWAEQLQSDHYIGMVNRYRKNILAIADQKQKSKVELAKAQQEADRVLRALSLGDRPGKDMVERAARLAIVDFGDAAVNEDMIARLLIAYRLRLENRKGLKRPVIAAIDNRLLWLADKKTRKLTSKRHWTLWPKAVGAIPRRALSHDLHGFLRKSEKAKEDRSLAKAAADAQNRLRGQ